MPLRTWNIREAFTAARDVYFLPRSTDASLSGSEQALCGEAVNACNRALNALQADDTWPGGQRQARFSDCHDRAFSLQTVDNAHYGATADHPADPGPLYDGIDLLYDAAFSGLAGATTFRSSVGA